MRLEKQDLEQRVGADKTCGGRDIALSGRQHCSAIAGEFRTPISLSRTGARRPKPRSSITTVATISSSSGLWLPTTRTGSEGGGSGVVPASNHLRYSQHQLTQSRLVSASYNVLYSKVDRFDTLLVRLTRLIAAIYANRSSSFVFQISVERFACALSELVCRYVYDYSLHRLDC